VLACDVHTLALSLALWPAHGTPADGDGDGVEEGRAHSPPRWPWGIVAIGISRRRRKGKKFTSVFHSKSKRKQASNMADLLSKEDMVIFS